jgi:hypothetical protein
MVEVSQGGEETPRRLCLCCGAPTASRSIPACWDHWSVLPEDLRSTIIVSHGRGQLKVYADSLFLAVRVWRLSGAWRSKYPKAAAPMSLAGAANAPESRSQHRIISLDEHRQKSAARAAGRSGSAAPFAARPVKSQS